MNEHESLFAAINEEVTLHEYSPAWPVAFDAERERLLLRFPGVFVDVQHIGSTSVPGLAAKPIIDILAGVKSMAVAESISNALCEAAYTTSAEFNETLTNRKWFMRWSNGHRTHHLHVVPYGVGVWHEHLRFRDALRLRPELAARYSTLKSNLAERHNADREAYTDAKSEFVRSVLQDA